MLKCILLLLVIIYFLRNFSFESLVVFVQFFSGNICPFRALSLRNNELQPLKRSISDRLPRSPAINRLPDLPIDGFLMPIGLLQERQYNPLRAEIGKSLKENPFMQNSLSWHMKIEL